ncbi:helicase-related protein [Pseudomonas sp. 770NI]|uniref:helicase-related protein n=1 Tax=Pseudomonas sp. 770NI TaxID=2528664 RepID=UPI00192D46D0|nr:helicase-related protein [Pseudomonas sp. 770NI]
MNNGKMEKARSDLVDLARALLQGPLVEQEMLEAAPSDTYLTGILWPRGTPAGPESEDGDGTADSNSDDDSGVPGYRALRPCSIGLTLYVHRGKALTVSLGTTARYVPVTREESAADDHRSRVWARQPLEYSHLVPADMEPGDHVLKDFVLKDGSLYSDPRLSVRLRLRHTNDDTSVCTFTLVNELDDVGLRDEGALFQTQLLVRAGDAGRGAILPRPVLPAFGDDEDDRCNALLYRNVFEFATGHGIGTEWDTPCDGTVHEVRTAWIPVTAVRGTSPDGHALLGLFTSGYPQGLEAAWLGRESSRVEVTSALRVFVESYTSWIETSLAVRLDSFTGVLLKAAEFNLGRCREACQRIREGVDALEQDEATWLAFSMANLAMDTQSRYPSKDSPRPLKWRPFQLAFMLMVLPGLADPSRGDRECMDLLWFPTGGGKTEAYLALTAFQIFHRRLVSAIARRKGGVDVLMRYTLRLLTVQQFQRATALIAACDAMRRGDSRLGTARISIGLYVGGDSTPNSMEKARESLEAEANGQKPVSTPVQLLRCPVCGNDLDASHYHAHASESRLDIICRNRACGTGGEPLPVLVVDETLYAEPPSLLIGTIDKFAQLPRTAKIRPLFGLDGREAPALIIQDELHLISGPLGSMAGLYETAVDLICTRDNVRPKVIGSTATIGQASKQVRALFDRAVLQFPPPGFESDDSFFAVRDTTGPDRLYVGLPTAGRSPKFALQALIAVLLQSASTLIEQGRVDDEAIDPYWTCVAYFNSLRELGGAHVLMQDDVRRHMEFMATRLGVNPRQLEAPPVELSSRKSSRELPSVLQSLSATLPQFQHSQKALEKALEAGSMELPEIAAQPENTVLASNMISVGVDVPRLGLMVVNGQPKSTAEYIQCSSRVGRSGPGLVFTLYNFSRPRDLSHFEHFQSYHSALYRSVEATSVTPWAPRARDKALHAVVVAVIRHLVPSMAGDADAICLDQEADGVLELLGAIHARASNVLLDSVTESAFELDAIHAELEGILRKWSRMAANQTDTAGQFLYWKKRAAVSQVIPHLLCSAEEAPVGEQAYPTPGSMREVEPSTAFVLKRIG